MKGMMLTFPIAWNGLLEKRIKPGQIDNINIVFGSKLDLTSNNIRGAINKFLHGTLPISGELEELMLGYELNNTIDSLVQHIESLHIKSIRSVVSAFHHFLKTEEIRVMEEDQRLLEQAIQETNPELYVARALIIAVRNRKETLALEQADIDRLRVLEKETQYPDAFGTLKNETGVISDDWNAELLQKVRAALQRKPGCFRKMTISVLKNMDMGDFKVFEAFCHMLFWDVSKFPQSHYPVVFEAKDHAGNDANVLYGMRTEDYVRLETLGLIAHLRDIEFHTWQVTEWKTLFSGSVLGSVNLRQYLIIRSKAENRNYDYKIKGWFLTDPGFQIYTRLIRPERVDGKHHTGYLTLLGWTLQDLELAKETPQYKFEIYPLKINPPGSARKMEIDFSRELLEEDMRKEYEKQTPHYAQMEDEREKAGFFEDKAKYEQYVNSFPKLTSVEIPDEYRVVGFD